MVFRRDSLRGSAPPSPRPKADVAARRLAAVLRWRTRHLLRSVTPAQARAIRFLPATLQTSFPYPGLRDEPPGVEGAVVGKKWASLAGSLGLPPPVATRRGRRAVVALLVTIGEGGVVGWAVPAENASAEERRRLDARVERIRQVLEGQLELVILDAAAPGLVPGVAAFAGLVAGRVPPWFWPAEGEVGDLDAGAVADLALEAPTPLAALAVSLLGRGNAPHPVVALRAELAAGVPARALADPELFGALWAGGVSGRQDELLRLIELTSRTQLSRRIASTVREPSAPSWRRETRTAGRLLALGRGLTLAAIRAASRAPAPWRSALRARLHRELVEPGAPAFLLPSLARALASAAIRGPEDLPPPAAAKGAFVVEDPAVGVLARGGSAAQAQLRAEALLARCLVAGSGGSGAAGAGAAGWRSRFERFAMPPDRRTVLVAVESEEVAGPPFDPLNRGPERRLAIGPSSAVVIRPGYRPTARRLSPRALVDRILVEGRAGCGVEIVAGEPDATPAASRLERWYRVVAGSGERRPPPAMEAGGRVYLLGERVRQFPLRSFATRPLLCDPDPEAPDLGVGGRSGTGVAPNRIECRLTRAGEDRAALLYVDEHGWVLREEVPLTELEEHLLETQAILRVPPRPATLALRVGPGFEGQDRIRRPSDRVDVPMKVWGQLPFGLGVELHGERFGGRALLGWSAAALSALSGWPPSATGRIRVDDVTVTLRGRPAGGLFRLYARSLAVRRVMRHMAVQVRLKDRAGRAETMVNAEIAAPTR
jgi:hypothetical protein